MKKKILLIALAVALFACLLAIGVSAATPEKYIEFGARFPGSDEYITVYTENAETTGNPRIDFAAKKFYSDIDFNNEVDMSTATGIDFSVAKSYVNGVQGNAITRMVKPSSPFVNCVEVKWFLEGMPTVSYNGGFFKGWTGLKSFDFGNATAINDNTFEGCGFESITIPASVTSFGGSVFKNCTSLTSVVISGNVTKFGNGSTFNGCTSLSNVTLSDISYIPSSMFSGCTSLASIKLPSTITKIDSSAFSGCSSLTSITIPENVTTIGSCAFYKTGITSLHIPAKVTYLGYQVAEASAIKSLTFAQGSELKHIDHRAFRDCVSLAGTVVIPEGVENIEYGLFSGCTSLKAVKLPSTFTTSTEYGAMFTDCTALEFVQLGGMDTIPNSMFENCYALKAISFPEGVKTISYKALRKCTSLQAVYLPSTLTSLGKTSDWTASDWGVFYQSPNVYLVNEPFDVFDGDTLLGDKFVMPEKPEVYYMPSSLSVVGNSEFQDCANLNDYIVFPVGVTTIADCSQGAFCNIGKDRASNPVTLVFLGDMKALQIRQNDAAYSNIHYVFANPNDVDLSCVAVTIGAANNKTQTNTYMYFCKGKVSYDLSTFKTANGAAYTVFETDYTKTTYTDETQPHFADVKKSVFTDPTCVDNKLETSYCFCGAAIGTSEVENTALGHNHSIYLGLIYESYLEKGNYSYKCERCEDVNSAETAPALFACLGFSVSKTGNGISLGFKVNNEAIATYVSETGKTLKYGVFAIAQSKLVVDNVEGDVFSADGTANKNAIAVEIARTDFAAFDIKVVGFANDSQRNAPLAMGAYVETSKDGVTEYSYMQASNPTGTAKYSYTSYNLEVNS